MPPEGKFMPKIDDIPQVIIKSKHFGFEVCVVDPGLVQITDSVGRSVTVDGAMAIHMIRQAMKTDSELEKAIEEYEKSL